MCGEYGHGTITCDDGLYCSRGLDQATGVCKVAGTAGQPCPEPNQPSCAGGLVCDTTATPPVCVATR